MDDRFVLEYICSAQSLAKELDEITPPGDDL
jgi:hypothetical protein